MERITGSVYLTVVQMRIAQQRVKLRLTQEDAAGRCGLSVRGYQALESINSKRRFNPGILQLWNIAFGLELDIDQLIGIPSAGELAAADSGLKLVNRVNLKAHV